MSKPRVPRKTIADYPLPHAVQKFYADLDAAGAAACAATDWWSHHLAGCCASTDAPRSGGVADSEASEAPGEWVQGWPADVRNRSQNQHKHRFSAGLHFVMGRMSPFYFERTWRRDARRTIWAVYFGPYTSNGRRSMGVAQGGAVSAVFDLLTAQISHLHTKSPTPTAELSVRMRRPTVPIPGVFHAEAWVENDDGRRVTVCAELRPAPGEPVTASCVAVLVRPKKRPAAGGKAKL